MESTSGRSLSGETCETCVALLKRIQKESQYSAKEKTAVAQLVEWLATFNVSDSSDTDDALDESSRALLASYTDKVARKRLASGLGDLMGSSPSIRPSLFVKHQRTAGQEALAAELDKVDDWTGFDVFKVAELSDGRPLEMVALAVLQRFELFEKLQIERSKVKSFLRDVEAAYESNPYHNSTHAADVTQSLGCILTQDEFSGHLSEMEILCMIIAATVHDVGHPGVSNEFLINSGAEVAVEYNDTSVNENVHAATAFRIFLRPKNNFLAHLSETHYQFFRRTVISIVLATDMAQHTDLLGDFLTNIRMLGPNISTWRPEQRMRVLQMCVHCSDIANPAKPLRFSQQWSERVLCEFFAQGDLEKQRGMTVSPQCDREKVEAAKSQLVFLDRVVRPCYNIFKLLAPNISTLALQLIDDAAAHWDRLQSHSAIVKGGQQLHCAAQANHSGSGGSFPHVQSGVFPLEDL